MSGISIFSGDESTKFIRLQVNYWVYRPSTSITNLLRNKYKNYLDIGVEIEGGEKTDISIYFPCQFSLRKSFSCIGKSLKEKVLADVLFNDSCDVSEGQHDIHSFSIKTDTKTLKVCTFEKSSISAKTIGEGTIVTIPVPKEKDHRYIRVRLDLENLAKQFSQETQPLGSWLQSIRTKNREIDFRVNSKRSIPQSILSDDKMHLASFEAIHFFYIASSEEIILFQNNKITSARFLESKTWDRYFGIDLKPEDKICAHHWKFEKKEEITLFFRANFPSTNFSSILYYLSFTAMFAITVNLASSFIFAQLNSEASQSSSLPPAKIQNLIPDGTSSKLSEKQERAEILGKKLSGTKIEDQGQ